MRRTYGKKRLRNREKGIKRYYSLFLLIFITLSFGYCDPVFKDALGRTVTPKKYPPQRIISLAPNITEILYAIDADERLIAVTDFCKYPLEAQEKEKIGGFINPNLEKIVSLDPDIVLVTADSNQKKVFDQMEKLHIPVFVINPTTLKDIFLSIKQISELCGNRDQADQLVDSLQKRVDHLEQKLKNAKKPKILFLWSEDPLITAGKNTFTDDLITLAGGINIAKDSKIKYPKYSVEEILRRKPEIIITSNMESMESDNSLFERWKDWRDIPAIKHKRIYSLDMELVARPAPSIVDGLEKMAKIIHPELFNEK